jgi:hypothetical protein
VKIIIEEESECRDKWNGSSTVEVLMWILDMKIRKKSYKNCINKSCIQIECVGYMRREDKGWDYSKYDFLQITFSSLFWQSNDSSMSKKLYQKLYTLPHGQIHL